MESPRPVEEEVVVSESELESEVVSEVVSPRV